MADRLFTEDQVRWLLRKRCDGNQARWARENGVPEGFVSDVLRGRRPVGADNALLRALGLKKVTRYERT